MSFAALLESGWNDHGDQPRQVADRLSASLHLLQSAADLPPLIRLLTHIHGEHLSDLQQGVAQLAALRSLPAYEASVEPQLANAIATLRYVGENGADLPDLELEQQVAVLATAAPMFAARQDHERAISAYAQALERATAGLTSGSPTLRALAVGGNNLAIALETKPARTASETAGMLLAAQGGLQYWKLAGTWLQEERAEYRLSRSQLHAGEARAAIASAHRCLTVCEANDASPLERFFGFAVLALAQRLAGDSHAFDAARQQARALYAQVPADEQHWCADELAELA